MFNKLNKHSTMWTPTLILVCMMVILSAFALLRSELIKQSDSHNGIYALYNTALNSYPKDYTLWHFLNDGIKDGKITVNEETNILYYVVGAYPNFDFGQRFDSTINHKSLFIKQIETVSLRSVSVH